MRVVRSWLGAVLCATLLVVPASAQSAPSVGGAPDTSTLRAIERQVSQIRGIQALAERDLQLLDSVKLHTFLTDAFDRDYLPSERESDQKQLAILGLINPTDDLVQIQLNLLSDQVGGVHDP